MSDKLMFNNEPGVDLVLALWNNGCTTVEIARKLGIGINTVEKILFARKILKMFKFSS